MTDGQKKHELEEDDGLNVNFKFLALFFKNEVTKCAV